MGDVPDTGCGGMPDMVASDSTEFEITPEMINAGILALLQFDSRLENEEDAVTDIFSAMWKAKEARHNK
jgi:hypothetical protein